MIPGVSQVHTPLYTRPAAPGRMQEVSRETINFSGQSVRRSHEAQAPIQTFETVRQTSEPGSLQHAKKAQVAPNASGSLLKQAMSGVKQLASRLWSLLTLQFLRENAPATHSAFSKLERLTTPAASRGTLAEIKQFSGRVEVFADSLTPGERKSGFADLAPIKKTALLGLTYDALRSEIPEIKDWGASVARHLGISDVAIAEAKADVPLSQKPDPAWDAFSAQVQKVVSEIPAEHRQKTYGELPPHLKSGIRQLVNYQATADTIHPKIEQWVSKHALALGMVRTSPPQHIIPVGAITPDIV